MYKTICIIAFLTKEIIKKIIIPDEIVKKLVFSISFIFICNVIPFIIVYNKYFIPNGKSAKKNNNKRSEYIHIDSHSYATSKNKI